MKKTKQIFKTLDTLLTEEFSKLEKQIQCYLDTRNFGLKVEFSKSNSETISSWSLGIDFDDFQWSGVLMKPHTWMGISIHFEDVIDKDKSFENNTLILRFGNFRNSFEWHNKNYDYETPSWYRVAHIRPKDCENKEIVNREIVTVRAWIKTIFSQFKRGIDSIDINDMQVYKEIEQTIRIEEKLKKLKSMDTEFTVFGSEKHKYQLNPVIGKEELMAFEKRHQIELPLGYRNFLLELGNGGVGPYYGLEPLENGVYSILDQIEKYKTDTIDISLPFLHTQKWNFNWEDVTEEDWEAYREENDAKYYHLKWINGLLKICNFGCGVHLGLVVNGAEFNNMWVDDRVNDNGIYPDPYFDQKEDERTSFLDWYEMWLDQSFFELNSTFYKSVDTYVTAEFSKLEKQIQQYINSHHNEDIADMKVNAVRNIYWDDIYEKVVPASSWKLALDLNSYSDHRVRISISLEEIKSEYYQKNDDYTLVLKMHKFENTFLENPNNFLYKEQVVKEIIFKLEETQNEIRENSKLSIIQTWIDTLYMQFVEGIGTIDMDEL